MVKVMLRSVMLCPSSCPQAECDVQCGKVVDQLQAERLLDHKVHVDHQLSQDCIQSPSPCPPPQLPLPAPVFRCRPSP